MPSRASARIGRLSTGFVAPPSPGRLLVSSKIDFTPDNSRPCSQREQPASCLSIHSGLAHLWTGKLGWLFFCLEFLHVLHEFPMIYSGGSSGDAETATSGLRRHSSGQAAAALVRLWARQLGLGALQAIEHSNNC
jgi:hypothetical protein